MDETSKQQTLPAARLGTFPKQTAARSVRAGFRSMGPTLGVYGTATALLIYRAPAILGDEWAWVALVLVPALTLLVATLRTGTALALVLVYAFVSATAMAVQGYRLGWDDVAQAQYIFSHFATVFFMAGAVALVAQIRSRQEALDRAQELVRRYVSEDEVTGLLTREAFTSAASRELSRSHRTSRPFLLIAIDLSAYFGAAGNSATAAIAERMLGEILCSQTRGDQDLWTMWRKNVYLGVLVETDEQAVEPALERVLARVVAAPEFGGEAVVEGALFGIACYPNDGYTLDLLLGLALEDLVPLDVVRERAALAGSRDQVHGTAVGDAC